MISSSFSDGSRNGQRNQAKPPEFTDPVVRWQNRKRQIIPIGARAADFEIAAVG
jgi:hypothetical protein